MAGIVEKILHTPEWTDRKTDRLRYRTEDHHKPDDRWDVQVRADLPLGLRTTTACMHPSAERLAEGPWRRCKERETRVVSDGVVAKVRAVHD